MKKPPKEPSWAHQYSQSTMRKNLSAIVPDWVAPFWRTRPMNGVRLATILANEHRRA